MLPYCVSYDQLMLNYPQSTGDTRPQKVPPQKVWQEAASWLLIGSLPYITPRGIPGSIQATAQISFSCYDHSCSLFLNSRLQSRLNLDLASWPGPRNLTQTLIPGINLSPTWLRNPLIFSFRFDPALTCSPNFPRSWSWQTYRASLKSHWLQNYFSESGWCSAPPRIMLLKYISNWNSDFVKLTPWATDLFLTPNHICFLYR